MEFLPQQRPMYARFDLLDLRWPTPVGMLIGALWLASMSGCGFPHDPEQTLQRVQGHTLRVGVVQHPPWAYRDGQGKWHGAEVDLVERLAEQLPAQVHWITGSESELIEALRRFELDLVIGGLTDDAVWSSEVGITASYYSSRISLGVRPGKSPPEELEGANVAAVPGSLAAALAKGEGAKVEYTDDLVGMPIPIAAESWQLAALEWAEVGEPWKTLHHVWAVPPGENAWLLYLDRYLPAAAADFSRRLAEEERQRLQEGQGTEPSGALP